MAITAVPTAAQYASAMQTIGVPKLWGTGPVQWVDAGGKPRGYSFRQHLTTGAGSPAGLFVDGFFKPTEIPGEKDKLSLSLLDRGTRILAIDENGVARHVNKIGVNRTYFQQIIGHPHLHTPSVDGLYGYAEPIPDAHMLEHWRDFIRRANILGAPDLSLPVTQGRLL